MILEVLTPKAMPVSLTLISGRLDPAPRTLISGFDLQLRPPLAPSPNMSSSKDCIWYDLTPAALYMCISCHLQLISHTSVCYQSSLEHTQYHPTSTPLLALSPLLRAPFHKIPTSS